MSGFTSNPGTTQIDGALNTRGGDPGHTPVAGDFACSAGMGSTAAVGTIVGSEAVFSAVLTSGGTGQGANPTCTYTFPSGGFRDAAGTLLTPVAVVVRPTRANQATINLTWTVTTTTLVITFAGTPVDTETYPFVVILSV